MLGTWISGLAIQTADTVSVVEEHQHISVIMLSQV